MSRIGKDIMNGLEQALAHARDNDTTGMKVNQMSIEKIDARAVRKNLHLTQDQMAFFLGTSPSGYKKWEQGQRQPSGAARTLLKIMEKEPEAVLRARAEH